MSVYDLCETKELSYPQLMEAVEEFVDTLVEEPSVDLYLATAKRLLGESLTHDEIMLGVPRCTPDDLIVLERKGDYSGDVTLMVSTDTQIRALLVRMKLGRKGLDAAYAEYEKLKKQNPSQTDEYQMAKVAQRFGQSAREMQLILTKMDRKRNMKEHYLQMAEDALMEEAPTNTQGSAMPDRAATDGDGRTCDHPKKRKKLSDLLKQQK